MTVMVAEVRWAGSDMDAIMEALSPADDKAKNRNAMQNFQSLPEFFTTDDWRVLQDVQGSMATKRDIIISRSCQLGLRSPAEQTIKYMTSLLLVLCEPVDSLCQMPSSMKHDLMRFTKTTFKSWSRRLEHPVVFLERLPATPLQLRQSHPKLYEAAYLRGESPISCKIDLKIVDSVDVSFRCREGSTAHVPRVSLQPPGSDMQGLVRFASTMMDSMNNMQQTQQQMLMFMGSGSASSGGRPLQSLGALTSGSAGGQLRQTPPFSRAVQDYNHLMTPSPVVAAAPAMLSLGDAPVASVPAAPAAPVATVSELPAAELPATPVSVAPPLAVAPGQKPALAMSLLAALDARELAKKETKKQQSKSGTQQESAPSKPVQQCMKRPAAAPSTQSAAKKRSLVLQVKSASPTFGVERSRSQVMCRTNLGGPGSTHAIKFGNNEQYKTEAAAVAAARKWLVSYGVQ
jgi:hypothetical protein